MSARVQKTQPESVQSLPGENSNRMRLAVYGIAHEWKTDELHMNADLMRSSRFKSAFHQTDGFPLNKTHRQPPVMRHGQFA